MAVGGRSVLVIAAAVAVALAVPGCGGKPLPGGGSGQETSAGARAAYDEAMAEGAAAMKAEEYDKAVAAYRRALTARPGDAGAQAGLDRAEEARDRVRKAAAALDYARQVSTQVRRLAALDLAFEQFDRGGQVSDLAGKQREVAEIRTRLQDIATGLEPDLAVLNDELLAAVEGYERALIAMGRGGLAGDLSVAGAIRRDHAAAREGVRRFAVALAEHAARNGADVAEVERLVPAE